MASTNFSLRLWAFMLGLSIPFTTLIPLYAVNVSDAGGAFSKYGGMCYGIQVPPGGFDTPHSASELLVGLGVVEDSQSPRVKSLRKDIETLVSLKARAETFEQELHLDGLITQRVEALETTRLDTRSQTSSGSQFECLEQNTSSDIYTATFQWFTNTGQCRLIYEEVKSIRNDSHPSSPRLFTSFKYQAAFHEVQIGNTYDLTRSGVRERLLTTALLVGIVVPRIQDQEINLYGQPKENY